MNALETPFTFDIEKVKQLQQQDTHIADIVTKCKSMKWEETTISWMNMVLYTEKIKDGTNISHVIMVPQTLQPYILYKSYNPLGNNASIYLLKYYYWKKLCQHCYKYVRSCPEC